MTVAVVTLAIALAAALAAVGYLAYSLRASLRSERASFVTEIRAGKAQVVAELAQRTAERLRDDANGRADKAVAERDAAIARLVALQRNLNRCREENAHATVVKIRSAPTLDAALGELDRLFAVVPSGATAAAVPARDGQADN